MACKLLWKSVGALRLSKYDHTHHAKHDALLADTHVGWILGLFSEYHLSSRAVGWSENSGMPVVIWWAQSASSGWDRVNWSAKIWGCHDKGLSWLLLWKLNKKMWKVWYDFNIVWLKPKYARRESQWIYVTFWLKHRGKRSYMKISKHAPFHLNAFCTVVYLCLACT